MPYFPNYRLGPLSDTNNPKDNEIYLYPNPANDKISVSSIIKGLNIIYDVTGRKILETYHDNIEISHLPSGMYYFCIQNNDHLIWTSKFIKL
jgi:hypothetical protein